MEFRYTKRQVARTSRADKEVQNELHLVKFVSNLRLTYQIRLLLFSAVETQCVLVLHVPARCRLSPELKSFLKVNRRNSRIRRL